MSLQRFIIHEEDFYQSLFLSLIVRWDDESNDRIKDRLYNNPQLYIKKRKYCIKWTL